jgi:probable HAF family extracellular repeat protein
MKPCRVSLWLTLCVSAIVQLPTAATQRAGPGAGSGPEAPIVLGTDGGNYSIAAAVNDRRQVVGRMLVGTDDVPRPFLWEDGVMRDLGTPGGPAGYGGAIDINDRGQVVGVTVDGDNPPAATCGRTDR